MSYDKLVLNTTAESIDTGTSLHDENWIVKIPLPFIKSNAYVFQDLFLDTDSNAVNTLNWTFCLEYKFKIRRIYCMHVFFCEWRQNTSENFKEKVCL
jgi:hypothetical protein